jgi:hypothetical protein
MQKYATAPSKMQLYPGSVVTETDCFTQWVDTERIHHLVVNPGAQIKCRDILEIESLALEAWPGDKDIKYPLLSDIRLMKSISRNARKYSCSPQNHGVMHTSANAIIIKSPVSRVIANFFLKHYSTPFPIKTFTSEQQAMQWLRTFL